jgi:peptidyl-dipeptidase A
MGLLDDYSEGLPATLNILYQEAFKLLPKLTLSLVFNQWFQDTYSNRVKPVNYNCHWWKLRSSLEGIKPPEFREASDFDPASHFNLISTPADNLKVFVESVLKYQVYTVLCGLSAHESIEVEGSSILPSLNINQTSRRGETSNKDAVSLRDCNLAGNSAVGERLSQLLSPGSSKSWQELLTHFGIRGGLDASAMLEYFKPLHAYLKEVNSRRELHVGWRQTLNDSCK